MVHDCPVKMRELQCLEGESRSSESMEPMRMEVSSKQSYFLSTNSDFSKAKLKKEALSSFC